MPVPTPATEAGREALRGLIAQPLAAVVGLDFDGTLSPIVSDPAAARPAPGAVAAVRRLARRIGVVAIVSGRPAPVVTSLLGFDDDAPDNVVVLGHYGLQRWTPRAGLLRVAPVDDAAVDAVRAALPAVLEAAGAPAGTAVEDKGESLAVHVRNTADPVAALAVVGDPLVALARAHGLRVEPGRMVVELRPPGVDKGVAVEALAREHTPSVVCYAGDDLGDVAAFDALDRLREAGIATLAIYSGLGEVPALQARADLVVDGPAALVGLLDGLADAIEEAREGR